MSLTSQRPADLARRLAARRDAVPQTDRLEKSADGQWRRETFTMPRTDAREKAKDVFSRFPKAAYMTEIEWWRELEDGQIEFTIRRLLSAD